MALSVVEVGGGFGRLGDFIRVMKHKGIPIKTCL